MAKLWTLVRRDGEMVISTSSALTDFQEGREVVIVFFEIVTSRSPCFQPGRIPVTNLLSNLSQLRVRFKSNLRMARATTVIPLSSSKNVRE